ncbi:MAG: hypothetical protein ACQKBW_07720, partial [Puniceicoccales bacterium]
HAMDHDNKIPAAYLDASLTDLDESSYWFKVYDDYISEKALYELLTCPNAEGYLPEGNRTCYGMNELLAPQGAPYWKLNQLTDPSRTLVLGDTPINPSWKSGGSVLKPNAESNTSSPAFRESGNTAAILFADGHVKLLEKDQLSNDMFTIN